MVGAGWFQNRSKVSAVLTKKRKRTQHAEKDGTGRPAMARVREQ